MRIDGNTIILKSSDEYYFKEENGIKPNTVRIFQEPSEIKDGFLSKKDKYIKRLLDCGIIDDLTATKMLKKFDEMI